MKLIDKDAVLAIIEKRKQRINPKRTDYTDGQKSELVNLSLEIKSLEVREVDFEKLGEIARHLIAVKEHIEDMRLDKEEWFMLEKIGYPERFKALKGE